MLTVPRHGVLVDADGSYHHYRISAGLTGQLRFKALKKPPRRKKFILFVHRDLVYRRALRLSSEVRITPVLIRSVSENLLPFDKDTVSTALNVTGEGRELAALQRDDIKVHIEAVGRPSAILTTRANEPQAMRESLQAWFAQGATRDFLGSRVWLPPSRLVTAGLAVSLAGLSAYGIHAFEQRQALQRETDLQLERRLSREARAVTATNRMVAHMRDTVNRVNEWHALDQGDLLDSLARIYAAIGAQSRISSIQFKDRRLIVKGWGSGPEAWLKELDAQGFETSSSRFPKEDAFTVMKVL